MTLSVSGPEPDAVPVAEPSGCGGGALGSRRAGAGVGTGVGVALATAGSSFSLGRSRGVSREGAAGSSPIRLL